MFRAARLPRLFASGVVQQMTTWGGRNPRRFNFERDSTIEILPRENHSTQGTTKRNNLGESWLSRNTLNAIYLPPLADHSGGIEYNTLRNYKMAAALAKFALS